MESVASLQKNSEGWVPGWAPDPSAEWALAHIELAIDDNNGSRDIDLLTKIEY